MRWSLLIYLIIFSTLEFFLLSKFIARKENTASKSAIVSLIFLWLVFIVAYIFKFNIPNAAYILVIISSIMDSYFGYYLKLYYKTKRYDWIQHMLGAFAFAVFFYFLFSNLFEYGGSRMFQAFYVLLLGVFYGTVYEIIEFINDLNNEEKMQRGLRDTNFDMVFNIIGSFAAAILARFVFL